MVVVSTPKMKDNGYELDCEKIQFCLRKLENFVEIPEAKWYWIEASDRQWEDRSGIRVGVICGVCDCCLQVVGVGIISCIDISLAERICKKLGIDMSGNRKPKTIFFRLLYQE